MSAEFKSLRDILRESRVAPPAISPLIPEPLPIVEAPEHRDEDPDDAIENRLDLVRCLERFEGALRRLLDEIAAEVVGRELLLAPIDVARIVTRLKDRYGFGDARVTAAGEDVTLECEGTQIDASLGRRLRSAIERALA